MIPEVDREKGLPKDELIENAKIIFAYTLDILQKNTNLQTLLIRGSLARNLSELETNGIRFESRGKSYFLVIKRETMEDHLSLSSRGIQQDLNVEDISIYICYKDGINGKEIERASLNYAITPKITDFPTDRFGNNLIAIEGILEFLRDI